MDDRTRFTTEQVLRGIQAYVFEHVDEKLLLDPDASVNDYREEIEESHECPLWFLSELASYFGFSYGDSRWIAWLQLPRAVGLSKTEAERDWQRWQTETSKPITIRKLAGHIAKHAPGTSLEPVTVFGVPCAPAGAFRGLCELPEVCSARVAPSTPLRNVVRGGRLREFWERLEWVTGAKLPKLRPAIPQPWFGSLPMFAVIFSLLAIPSGLGIMHFFDGQLGALPFALFGALAVPFVILCLLETAVDWARNPLPDGITTFGDLARLIASNRTATP